MLLKNVETFLPKFIEILPKFSTERLGIRLHLNSHTTGLRSVTDFTVWHSLHNSWHRHKAWNIAQTLFRTFTQ